MTSIERGNRVAWWLGIIVTLEAVLLVTVTLLGFNQSNIARQSADKRAAIVSAEQTQLVCVAKWADAYSARANRIAGLNTIRLTALDALVRSIAKPDNTQATFETALNRYLAASDRYTKAIAANPLPPSPKFAC